MPVGVAGVGIVEGDQAERIHAGGQVERNGPRIAAAIVKDARGERRVGGLVDPQRGRVLEVQRDAADAVAGLRAEEFALEDGKPTAWRPRGGDGEGPAPRRQRRVQLAEHDRLDPHAGMILVGERAPGARIVVARRWGDPPNGVDQREDGVHAGVEGVAGALRVRVDVGGADRAEVLRGGPLRDADVKLLLLRNRQEESDVLVGEISASAQQRQGRGFTNPAHSPPPARARRSRGSAPCRRCRRGS